MPERFRRFFEALPDPFFVIDAESGMILEANEMASRLYGYSANELLQKHLADLSAEPDASTASVREAANSDGQLSRIQMRKHRRKDGSVFPVEISARSLIQKGRRLLLATARDITDQTISDEKLKQAQQRLEYTIEGAHVGTWEWNVQTGEASYNEEWARIAGYTLEELSPLSLETWLSLVHPDDNQLSNSKLEKHFSGELPFFDMELRMRHKYGDWVWIHSRGRVVTRDEDGKPLMMFGTHSDITVRKRSEQIEKFRSSILESLAQGSPLEQTLKSIVLNVEESQPDLICSISLVGASGTTLGRATAPSLPPFYREALDGIEIGPGVGSCGAAAFEQRRVIVEDISTHPYWVGYSDLAAKAGLKSCWSQPVFSSTGKVLGVFAIYHRNPTVPDENEIAIIEQSVHLVSIAVQSSHAAAELRESEYRFRSFFETNSSVILVIDSETGNIVEANGAAASFYGYTTEHLRTLNIRNINTLPPERITHLLKEALEADSRYFMFVHRLASGELRDVEAHASRVQSGDQKELLATIIHDVTDRKRAEDARGELLARLQKIAQQLPGVVYQYLLRPDGTSCFPFASEAIRDIYRVTPEEVATDASSVYRRLHPEDYDGIVASIQESARSLLPWLYEYRVLFDDGTLRWLNGTASPEKQPDGSVLWHGFITDVTERRQAEDDKAKLEAQLQQTQKLEALGVLVAGVAHNLNNVLAAVMGTASLRGKFSADAQDAEAFHTITTACRRGRDVVNSLTQFAKPSLTQHAEFNLHDLISEVLTLITNTTRNRIRVVEKLCEASLWVVGDAGSISSALMNLFINATDAMPRGGTLTIRTRVLADLIEIAVDDTGEGMSPETLNRAMDPFFTTKPIGHGTGLGLSMTHGILKAHGGHMEISSDLGYGTTVTMLLPRAAAPQKTSTNQMPNELTCGLSVLLVDDEEDIRFLVARMLKSAGLSVRTVASGQEALEVIRAGLTPDLVILDQNMPGMNGTQTMEQMRLLDPNLPILVSSGQPDIQDWECFKVLHTSVIPKPFELDELLAKLERFSSESMGSKEV